jgi:hypothetical protein
MNRRQFIKVLSIALITMNIPKSAKAKQLRRVQLFKSDNWVDCKLQDIKSGNIFRMFESDGDTVKDNKGYTKFLAVSDPSKNREGIWSINSEPIMSYYHASKRIYIEK